MSPDSPANRFYAHGGVYPASHIPDVAKKVHEDSYQVTEWLHPYETMESQYGTVTCKRWLDLESLRWMETNLRDSWIKENKEGMMALFSWRKYYREV